MTNKLKPYKVTRNVNGVPVTKVILSPRQRDVSRLADEAFAPKKGK